MRESISINGTDPQVAIETPRPISEEEMLRNDRRIVRDRMRQESGMQHAARLWWRFRRRELNCQAYLDPNPSRHAAWNDTYNQLREILEREDPVGVVIGLLGPHGSGKTVMATGLMLLMIHQMRSAKYIKLFALNLELEEALKSDSLSSRREIIARLVKPHLLVIDECSAASDSEANARCLRHLLDERYGASRDTILISNQSEEDFSDFLGDALVDRLNHTAGIWRCPWSSFRT